MPSSRMFLALLAPALVLSQGVEHIKANYTKHEFEIPARDGVKLFTAVYTPKDTSKTYPILMTRTPYSVGPYGVDKYRTSLGPTDLFGKAGYIFVYQDVRGRWMSEGTFEHLRPHNPRKSGPKDIDESSDTCDSIDWLLKNIPGHNGRVGISGISYPGFYTVHGVLCGHPALKAASPQAPVTDMFIGDDFHHNGALFLPHAFNFLVRVDQPEPHEPINKYINPFDHGSPNGYEFFLRMGPLANANEKYLKNRSRLWNEMMKHPNYDEYWQVRATPQHLRAIKPAMLTVGGWFDAEDLYGPLKVYEAAEKNSPGARNQIVMGPWYHGQWARDPGESLGFVKFNAKTSEFYREKIEFPFFEHLLKDKEDPKLPEAYMFETGTNQWQRHDEWPPKNARPVSLYFRDKARLSFDAPADERAADEYTSDPAKPVPVVDYVAIGMTREYMVDDQRFASTRTDVLTYETEPLKGDFTVAGPLTVTLWLTTTGTDADFVVKLIDVYPNDYPDPDPNPKQMRMGGFQQLVRGEPFRGRFRNSFSKPEPFKPGEITKLEFEIPDSYHAFRRDHKIMVQVQSSWFPLVDRNPQKFVDIYNAREADFQKATHQVHRTKLHASKITVRAVRQ